MAQLSVSFYKTISGREPVRDWLMDLSKDDRRILGEDIKTVQIGWPLGMPLVRKMEKDIWEIRSNVSAGIARVFFTLVKSQIVLLHGFVKKTQKTPQVDIEIARRRSSEVHNG